MIAFFIICGLIAMHTVALFSAGHALLHKRDSRSALGWVAISLLTPFVGPLLYWLFGIARIDSRASKLMERAAQQVIVDLHGKSLVEEPPGFVPEECLPAEFSYLACPGKRITGRCMIGNNTLTPLHNGEAAYPVMLDAIGAAQRRVYLSSFIFGYDQVGKRFAEALKNAAQRGCDVRVLVDGVGSFHPFANWRTRLGGAQLAYFLPPRLFPPQFSINLRTHRKMLVCDGVMAFTGGMNISQHHLTELHCPDRVQDLHFRCVGPIAEQLEVAFLMDWSFTLGSPPQIPLDSPSRAQSLNATNPAHATTPLNATNPAHATTPLNATNPAHATTPLNATTPARIESVAPERAPVTGKASATFPPQDKSLGKDRGGGLGEGKGEPFFRRVSFPLPQSSSSSSSSLPQSSSLCRLLMDGPGAPGATIQDLFCAQISTARRSVRIMSPYFLPPHQLASALTSAVLRGVEVNVILPGENNHRFVDWAMRHHMPILEEQGVHISYQPAPFAHTKLLLIDEAYTLLGSANLDPRSLNLNFELVMEVLDPVFTRQLTAFYDEVQSHSVPAPGLPALPVRLRNAASWIFSPYL